MSANKPDTEQIRKYLNGELDARAMHQLERQAQDDPFLMEALEGYETSAKNQQPNLNELKNRLQSRVTEKKKPMVLWRVLPIAASLLIIGGLAWLWLSPKGGEKKSAKQVAINTQPARPKLFIPSNPVSPEMQPQADSMIRARRAAEQNQIIAGPTYSGKSKMRYYHYTTDRKRAKDIREEKKLQNEEAEETLAKIEKRDKDSISKPATTSMSEIVVTQYNTRPARFEITGKITDTSGHPLPGARVIVKGTNIKAITNAKGEYSLPADVNKDSVTVQMIGYETQRLAVNGANKLDIKLIEASNSLAEVEVTHKARPADVHDAQPQDGWKSYMAYLTQKAVMPDGQTGRVKLRFSVDTEGRISNIRVVRGRSDSMNRRAIELVMNGPKWYGPEKTNVDESRQKEIKLKIKFHKA